MLQILTTQIKLDHAVKLIDYMILVWNVDVNAYITEIILY